VSIHKKLVSLRADVPSALRRTLHNTHLPAPVLASDATQLISPKPTPEAVSGLPGKWKVWDVRASLAGSPRGALTGGAYPEVSWPPALCTA
jgi:hypothetical protein